VYFTVTTNDLQKACKSEHEILSLCCGTSCHANNTIHTIAKLLQARIIVEHSTKQEEDGRNKKKAKDPRTTEQFPLSSFLSSLGR
jgi:hypothetical protein